MTQEQYYWYVLRRQQLLKYKAAGYGASSGPSPVKDVGLCFEAIDNDTGFMLVFMTTDSERHITIRTPDNFLTSNDGETWGNYNFTLSCVDEEMEISAYVGDHVALANAGDKAYIKAANRLSAFSDISGDSYRFVADGMADGNISFNKRFALHNSIMWLVDPTGKTEVIPNSYCFNNLFMGCLPSLIKAPELPALALKDYCYQGMFNNCVALSTPPALPAMTLAKGCYESMFDSCTRLSSCPALPATTLADECYYLMFNNCQYLDNCPELPATTLCASCYHSMFKESGVFEMVELPATTLADSCYTQMFYNCKVLSAVKELPATTLADNCYSSMFTGCVNIKECPTELPAKVLKANCYQSMFEGCESLLVAPRLVATTLDNNCYKYMFSSCSSLNSVSVSFTDWGTDNQYTDNWFEEAPATGTFYCSKLLSTDVEKGWSTIPEGWTVVQSQGLRFTAQQADSSVQLNYYVMTYLAPEPEISGKMWYSTNCIDWVSCDFGPLTEISDNLSVYYGNVINLPEVGDHVYFMSDSKLTAFSRFGTASYTFGLSGKVAASDSVMWLVDNQNGTTLSDIYMGTFQSLFDGCSALTQAPELPATNLNTGCYASMFKDCTSLTSAPTLNSTLSAVPDYCYSGMFQGCTSLTDISKIKLVAKTLDEESYSGMFQYCTSLKTSPVLPATNLADGCYACMFQGCTSLTDAPALPATDLCARCYSQMFAGCTSLSSTPALPSLTLVANCYDQMFSGCSNVNAISSRFLQWENYATEHWLSAVAPSGTFNCAYSLDTYIRSDTYVPTNWTVVKAVPTVSGTWYLEDQTFQMGRSLKPSSDTIWEGGIISSLTSDYCRLIRNMYNWDLSISYYDEELGRSNWHGSVNAPVDSKKLEILVKDIETGQLQDHCILTHYN